MPTLHDPAARDRLLRELNDHIWRAYRHAFRTGDADTFLALFAPDLIRAGGPAKTIEGFAEYDPVTRQWLAELALRGDSVDIEFRFTERIVRLDLASERGYYRLTAMRADGDRKVLYGRFHTFARRIEGRWRIVVDYDSDENASVTEADFAAADALD